MKLKKLSSEINKLSNSCNLTKKYPGYFRKWVFRSMLIIVLINFLAVGYTNDMKFSFTYAECKENMCKNPFYICPEVSINPGPCIDPDQLGNIKDICLNNEQCQRPYLYFGEIIGTKPNLLARSFTLITILLIGLSFGINHILYKWRGEYGKP